MESPPLRNHAGDINTLANGDSLGGLWPPDAGHNHGTMNWWELIPSSDNPIHGIYGSGSQDPRHFGTCTRTHIDPSDTHAYIFYSARNDAPLRSGEWARKM